MEGGGKMTNSDELVRENVVDVLKRQPGVDIGDIDLHVEQGVVTLTGTVDNPQVWHETEKAIEGVPGVQRVDNQLRLSEGRLNEALNDFSATGAGTAPAVRGKG
jgi:osmotically-inducible protein OsmY